VASVEHFNGTANTVIKHLIFTQECDSLYVQNTGSETLLVSFDTGNNYLSVLASKGLHLTFKNGLSEVCVKSLVDTTTYEIVTQVL